jgi:hypothetical protein
MRRPLLVSILAVTGALALSSVGAANAQERAQSKTGSTHPNFQGVWVISGGPAYPGTRGSVTTFNLKIDSLLQPWAQERCAKIGCTQGWAAGGSEATRTGREYDESDSPILAKCAPVGLMKSYTFNGPFQIVYASKKEILMFWQSRDSMRHIWMDGRQHTRDPLLWMGESIGHWEGDTLVVDTIGINDHGYFDSAGHPHTNDLHVVERIRLIDPKTLQFDFLFDDPKTFTQPFKGRLLFQRHPEVELTEDITCEDRILSDDSGQPFGGFGGGAVAGEGQFKNEPLNPRPPAPEGSGRKY